jgi:hypothetical protein
MLELQCLRLASDLVNLATGISNPDLKAHCIRMAKALTDQAENSLTEKTPMEGVLHHRSSGDFLQ